MIYLKAMSFSNQHGNKIYFQNFFHRNIKSQLYPPKSLLFGTTTDPRQENARHDKP